MKKALIWIVSIGIAVVFLASAFFYYALQIIEVEQPEDWSFQAPPQTKLLPTGDFNLSVVPKDAQIDRRVRIEVSGVMPGEEVLLRASTTDAEGTKFESWVWYIADDTGYVDLNAQSPQSGSYLSVDSMGLFWSMEESGRKRFRHSERWMSREYNVSAETSEAMVSLVITRRYPANSLQLAEISTDLVEAELWNNPAVMNQSIIIRLPGSDGRQARLKSSLLASKGFAVLDLRYHRGNSRGMPPSNQIPVERVVDAINWLEANSEEYNLNSNRIGLFGTSKGAELGLIAGGYDKRIDALFLWAPASMVFEGGTLSNPKGGSSWTWKSESVPYAKFRSPYLDGAIAASRLTAGKAFSFLPIYLDAIEDADAAAQISVARLPGSIMLVGGEDDRMWPSAIMGRELGERMRAMGQNCVVEKYYENVGHRMNYEQWPRGGKADLFVMGGRRDASYRAGADAWARMIKFFDKTLIADESFCH